MKHDTIKDLQKNPEGCGAGKRNRFLCAPLEGITGFPFRQTHHKMFPGVDQYYTPFLVANQTMKFKNKEMRDVLPENNAGVPTVPQILTNRADQFVNAVQKMRELGYTEVNLNLGCPMPMQVTKKRGAGFLADQDALDRFFDESIRKLEDMGLHLAENCAMENLPAAVSGTSGQIVSGDNGGDTIRISVKTRIGLQDAAEADGLMKIFNRYPLSLIVIHARRGIDRYKGVPDLETFGSMLEQSRHPVCYNGDLFTMEDITCFQKRFPTVDMLMIGRGLLRNPALAREAAGGPPLHREELREYLQRLYEAYHNVISGDVNVMYKMKELWTYAGTQFTGADRHLKQIRKARNIEQYEAAVAAVFREGIFCVGSGAPV